LFIFEEEELGILIFSDGEASVLLFSLEEVVLGFSIFLNGMAPPFVFFFGEYPWFFGLEEDGVDFSTSFCK
jgi:hypothetical protein